MSPPSTFLSEASKKRDGSARRRQTEIINHCIQRKSDGTLAVTPDDPWFTEVLFKTKEDFNIQQAGGTHLSFST